MVAHYVKDVVFKNISLNFKLVVFNLMQVLINLGMHIYKLSKFVNWY
jgi:hypothetical protein